MAEHRFPKPGTRVRSPSPAPDQKRKKEETMKDAIWIVLSIAQLITLVGLVACLPHLYRREADKEGRA